MTGRQTPGGHAFTWMGEDEATQDSLFVILVISGEYSSITWSPVAVATSLEEATAWIDAHPLKKRGWPGDDDYEVWTVPRADKTDPRLPEYP